MTYLLLAYLLVMTVTFWVKGINRSFMWFGSKERGLSKATQREYLTRSFFNFLLFVVSLVLLISMSSELIGGNQ